MMLTLIKLLGDMVLAAGVIVKRRARRVHLVRPALGILGKTLLALRRQQARPWAAWRLAA